MIENEQHNSFQNPSPQTARLIEVLTTLEHDIKRQNSLKFIFLKGTIYGLGTVIGATVLVALLGGIITSTFGTEAVSDTAIENLIGR